MNILMMTNTYLPYVGGVATSVAAFTDDLRQRGHHVVVVAPEYDEAPDDEPDVIRLPAIQHFTGGDFSVIVPIHSALHNRLEDFKPDIVHCHHPYLIGSTAVRVAKKFDLPLVYTQHTMYEQYTHYVPVGSEKLKEFVVNLSTGYSNMADMVIAPSDSIAEIIRRRGVQTPIEVIPTGIDIKQFAAGSGQALRQEFDIVPDAWVVGHLGRLAPEKNLDFLSEAVAAFLLKEPRAHFVVVGYGPSQKPMNEFFTRKGLQDRVHFAGKRKGRKLSDAYHAMDVFAFSSKSETQGLVVAEAMACGVPVVALDAPGVREVVTDGVNGYLLSREDSAAFADALARFFSAASDTKKQFGTQARQTAEQFTTDKCVSRLLAVYEQLHKKGIARRHKDETAWEKLTEHIKTEWELLTNITDAIGDSL